MIAVRAGEAGQGFAVVAGGVKELAAQTAVATGDVSAKIATIQADTAAVSKALASINETIHSMDNMDNIQTQISSVLEEQSATAHQFALGLG